MTHIKRGGRTTGVLVAIVALFGFMAAGAFAADDFVPDEDQVEIAQAATYDVPITLVAGVFNPGQDDQCQLQGGGHYVEASVTSSDEGVATVSPSALKFDNCGDTRTITITAVDCGEAVITIKAVKWTARTGFNAEFSDGEIRVTVTNCDNGGGDLEVCAKPAAPAWANAILQAHNGSVPKNQQIKAKAYGDAVSAVAKAMENGATFNGVAKSDQDNYAHEVWEFLEDYTGKSLPHPSDPGVARPGWACVNG
ncbi:hypothetical protein [Nocardioides limicola]|uniref:hypothetical protein n=1 Tax=Nocardioides limicola TaxID=2803368 RepID=UPI00193B8D27|nr:hypothetical protein [Nocardioides sp. DJM-14]